MSLTEKSQGHSLSIKNVRIEEERVESSLVLVQSTNGMAAMLKINPQADF